MVYVDIKNKTIRAGTKPRNKIIQINEIVEAQVSQIFVIVMPWLPSHQKFRYSNIVGILSLLIKTLSVQLYKNILEPQMNNKHFFKLVKNDFNHNEKF